MIKCFSFLFILLLSQLVVNAQKPVEKERRFTQTIKKVLQGLEQKDSASLARLTHRETGFYILHRMGLVGRYTRMKNIGFSDTTHPFNFLGYSATFTSIVYKTEPEFDCDSMKYIGGTIGVFVDTTDKKGLFTSIVTFNKERLGLDIPEDLKLAKALDAISRRVTAIDADGNYVTFYLMYREGKWWLNIIDLYSNDCSA